MLPFIDPCLPMRVTVAPRGPLWLHEIKHDGYRLTDAGRRADPTRRGYDWTDRYPRIVEAYPGSRLSGPATGHSKRLTRARLVGLGTAAAS
jgi:ATP-dependent DNA ligase